MRTRALPPHSGAENHADDDPELRYTPSGSAVASFTIASTPRTFDRDSNEWTDGDTLFLRCSLGARPPRTPQPD